MSTSEDIMRRRNDGMRARMLRRLAGKLPTTSIVCQSVDYGIRIVHDGALYIVQRRVPDPVGESWAYVRITESASAALSAFAECVKREMDIEQGQ